jgi:hypothetical protein
MTKQKQDSESKARKLDGPAQENEAGAHDPDFDWSRHVVGVESKTIANSVMYQLCHSIWHPKDASAEEVNRRTTTAGEMLHKLKPRDMQEGLLCSQMVATHYQLMECNRRAMIPEQTFEGRDMALKHAAKLANIYTKQMETLDKHRGKGQQKITVEHVNVHAGGQAIVGNVENSSAIDRPAGNRPAAKSNALPEPDREAMPVIDLADITKAKVTKRTK